MASISERSSRDAYSFIRLLGRHFASIEWKNSRLLDTGRVEAIIELPSGAEMRELRMMFDTLNAMVELDERARLDDGAPARANLPREEPDGGVGQGV